MKARSTAVYAMLRLARNVVHARMLGVSKVHPTASLHPTSQVSKDLEMSAYGFVGRECRVSPGVSIGKYSMLAPRVAIVGADHVIDVVGTPIQFSGRPPQSRTVIEDDVWVGASAIIMRGVTIGEGAVVGAGAVVTKDVPSYEIWAGVPARRIATRFTADEQEEHHRALHAGPIKPTFADRQSVVPL